jgi:DUF4097 and DUF4098 domain-containing protein YvlB
MTTQSAGVLFVPFLLCASLVNLSGCNGRDTLKVRAATDSGPLSIQRMGGDIDVSGAPGGANLATMGGNIHVGSVGSFAKIKTMGGDIAVDHANASIDAVTMGGKITIEDANGPIQASTMGGDIAVRETRNSATRRDIELSSKSGTIALTVPKDFPMEVRVTLAYTRGAGDHFRVINHIGLSQQETQEWDDSHGSPRKYIRALGRVGSGLNHVTIETVNGDVILRQE